MKKSKILFILHLPPPVHGAGMVGKYIKDSLIINQAFECDYINLSTSGSIDQIGKRSNGKIAIFVKLLLKVIRSLFKKKHDLYYITLTASGPGFYKDLLIVTLLKAFGKKIVYHFHNKGIAKNKSKTTNYLYKFAFRNTKSILLSPLLYAYFKYYAVPEQILYCANGIPEETESTFIGKEKEYTNCRNLLFLSNLLTEKGVYTLLDACSQLKKMNVAFTCHFVGSWGDITEQEFNSSLSKFELSDHITIHGKKYGSEKNQLFQMADVFVLPTHNDCFPLVLLEAMQFRLPIVSTYEGGIPDIVTDNETGFLIQKKNSTELAAKLKLLLESPALSKQMGKAGYEKYKKLFTIERFETEMISTLQKVIQFNQ